MQHHIYVAQTRKCGARFHAKHEVFSVLLKVAVLHVFVACLLHAFTRNVYPGPLIVKICCFNMASELLKLSGPMLSVAVGVLGPGLIGSALINQINKQVRSF